MQVIQPKLQIIRLKLVTFHTCIPALPTLVIDFADFYVSIEYSWYRCELLHAGVCGKMIQRTEW